jgi:long-chain acyl-CoA synthetase
MGANSSRRIIYNKLENPEESLSGPYINPEVNDFNEVIKKYKTKSWIEEFQKVLPNYLKRDCLGFRKHLKSEQKDKIMENTFADYYSWFNYEQVMTMSTTLSKNIKKHKLYSTQKVQGEGEFNFLGFFSRNMVEYLITDLACQLNNITSVTFYATLGDEAFNFINSQTDLTTMCVSPDDNIDILIKYKKQYGFPHLKNVIIFDMTLILTEDAETKLKKAGLNVYYFSALIKNADEKIEITNATSDSVYALCYTSGTTGLPKGAKITQRNIIAQMELTYATGYKIRDETILFYLPLAHVMEKINCFQTLLRGCRLGCISGEVRASLRADLMVLKPTCLVAVPRVLNLFRNLIIQKMDELPDGWKKNTALIAIQTKRDNFNNNKVITHAWYDLAVFKKVRESFGGNLRVILSSSAPLTKEVMIDLKILFSIPILESYGLTENTGASTCTNVNDQENLSAGGCLLSSKFKLVDVPEMNYNSKTELDGKPSPTGEVCLYGPLIFGGYFKNDKLTKEVIDEEGWLHTGDIGRIVPEDMGLLIIDRKKEIFKLSQGEYIAPTKLESVYGRSKYVGQLCIYGDSIHDYIIAIIIPNRETVLQWLKENNKVANEKGLSNKEINEYFKDKELEEEIVKDLQRLAKENNLNGLERVNNVLLNDIDFTIDNGCVTPTLKIVRRKVIELLKDKIEQVYSKKK